MKINVVRWVMAWALVLVVQVCGSPLAMAQTKGDVVSGQFKVQRGGLVTLPAGRWTVVDAWNLSSDSAWAVTALQNNDADSNTPYLVVRVNTLFSKGKTAMCDMDVDKTSLWMKDALATKPNQLTNKCIRVWDIGRQIGGWARRQKASDKGWWKEPVERLGAAFETYPEELAMAESEIRVFNSYGLQITAFIKIRPFGTTLADIRDARLKNRQDATLNWWKGWLSDLVNANTDSFFNDKKAQLAALATPVAVTQKAQIPHDAERPSVPSVPPVAQAVLVAPPPAKPIAKGPAQPNDSATVYANRRALVIGNDAYRHVHALENAREDARAMAEGLRKVGYQVTLKTDLDEKEMKVALRHFKSQIEGGDEVLFFFAGHGVQIANTNYLLPIDISGESEAQLKDDGIPLQRVLDDMTEQKAKFSLALIDACRDNPFKVAGRSLGGRGLSPTTAATGQMIVFSAGTGQQALDKLGPSDSDKNGLFTRVFLKQMQTSGVSIDKIVRNVRTEVVGLAKSVGHEQVPAIYDQVVGDFYFRK